MTWSRVSSVASWARAAFAAMGFGKNSASRDTSGTVQRMKRKPSQDAMLLMARREILIADVKKRRRQRRAVLACSRELREITHRILSDA